MDPAANQRVSPNRVVLVLALLLGVWLAFQFYPRKKPAPPLPPVMAESKLRAVGLPDNVDLEGLPEFFAVWADRIEWYHDRTEFAYWNPGSRSYSYFFEAFRTAKGYTFRVIPDSYLKEWDYEAGPEEGAESMMATHPFDFSPRRTSIALPVRLRDSMNFPKAPAKQDIPPQKISVDMEVKPLPVPRELEEKSKPHGTNP